MKINSPIPFLQNWESCPIWSHFMLILTF
uniref:Uncharacterized protein n=1 Tax=Rhizophora mucronata TaxID=61149 RepID=A0A2P2JJV6_RHIMU